MSSLNTISSSEEVTLKTVEYSQTPEEHDEWLAKVNKEYEAEHEKNQPAIDDLKESLKVPSAEESLLEAQQSGKEVYEALKKEGNEKAIQDKVKEFNSYDSYRNADWTPWTYETVYQVITKFPNLLEMSDKEIEETYLKYFEPQNSIYGLGKLIIDAEHIAFTSGFLSAMNWKIPQWLWERLLLAAKFIDKLTLTAKKYREKMLP